ncbi:dienelactone hydrolase family protein [Synechococcus sp. Nb3U1]|uniref:dienelactone hydrolase family protein n=1 Tax=Synechococcus sp. Nb3U1 TaxID=1914529 RepID=UPI001F431066|nr:dienelactone hydrolase family protein [Synechococcus sp. Nb3U1]MCF2970578.1 dienelactone hydrolase family protein [Synechococcus sp. Nb3U1]
MYAEQPKWLSTTQMKRRQFVVASVTAGFALAVQPISAQTLTTDSEGLEAGPVTIPTPNGEIPGYRAKPMGSGLFRLVLVVQEIFGVHEHIQDICRRFAKLGYVAVAPELFYRQGDVSQLQSFEEIRAIVSQVPDAQVMADLDAAMDWAIGNAAADPERVGITGFCWGGRITWLYAAHQPNLKAGVAWYGRLVGESTPLTPTHPVDVAANLNAPVLGLYGGEDTGIPLETVEQMKSALEAAGDPSQFVIYPDAPHAFFADYRPSYRPEAASDAWERLQAWFQEHGVV